MHRCFTVGLTDCSRYHMLRGTYGLADLQALSPLDRLATALPGSFLHVAKADGVRERHSLSAKQK